MLVDGRRLGQGSPYTFFTSPAPDLDQIPAGLVDRVEVVTGGASAAYGSDAIAGVVNFIMKKNFEGFQIDGNMGENWHDNNNTYVQGLVRDFGGNAGHGYDSGRAQQNLRRVDGHEFCGRQGQHHRLHELSPRRSGREQPPRFRRLPARRRNEREQQVTGTTCGGSSNSNFFHPTSGPNAGNVYSVFGTASSPSAARLRLLRRRFNSQPYIYMTREDDRYNAAFMAHQEVTEAFQPYGEFYFMDDKTHQVVAPSALFRTVQSARSDRAAITMSIAIIRC